MWLSTNKSGKREREGAGKGSRPVAGVHRNVQIDLHLGDVEIIGSSHQIVGMIFIASWTIFGLAQLQPTWLRQLEELREQRRQVEEELRKVGRWWSVCHTHHAYERWFAAVKEAMVYFG